MSHFVENGSCPHCGSEVVSGAVFWRSCSRRIRGERGPARPIRGREAKASRPRVDVSPTLEAERGQEWRVEDSEVNTSTVVLAAALAGTVVLFFFLTASMNSRLERSNEELANLRLIGEQYSILVSNHSALRDEYLAMKAEQAGLQSQLNAVNENYTSLSHEYSVLQTSYKTLQAEYHSFETEYQKLTSREEQIQTWYDGVRDSVNLRLGCELEDWEVFVTPADASVQSLVLQVTGGWRDPEDPDEFLRDVKRLYDWVEGNVEYSYDSPCPSLPSLLGELSWRTEHWRFPNETIQEKHGDCEDSAVLLCSLMRSYSGREYLSYCIVIEGEVGHAAVAFPVSNEDLVVLDPVGHYYTGRPGPVEPKPVEEAINDWLSIWGGRDEAAIYAVFNEEFHKGFSSNQDFINWATSR